MLILNKPPPMLEFSILSGVLGVTTLVDGINNGKPSEATEPTILGPFFKEDAREGIVPFSDCFFQISYTM